MQEENGNFILLCVVGVLIALITFFIVKDMGKMDYDYLIHDEEEMLIMLTNAGEKYVTKINFECTMNPTTFDYYEIFRRLIDRNYRVGCEIYGYYFDYTIDNDNYKLKLVLQDPSVFKVFMSHQRVKSIAKKLDKLDSDYDKIKAAHDYLIILNDYSADVCGAYNGLYSGKCACNGYAYSFYEIMKELNIPVTCEFGNEHVWNRVQLDNEWYNIDLTWDDIGDKNVSYDFFLKSDSDWLGHEHGGATALKSYEVTGNDALSNYYLIPNYKYISVAVAFITVSMIIILIIILKNRKYK